MTELEPGENPLRSRPISLSSRSLSWAVVKPHQAEAAYSMDARVVDRATSNNWGPQPVGPRHAEGVNGRSARGEDLVQMAAHCKVGGDGYTKDPHRGNPGSTLEDGGWVNRGARAALVDNELSGF